MNALKTLLTMAALLLLIGCASVTEAPPAPAAPPMPPRVEMKTSMGSFVIELYPDKAPVTVANFLQYVTDGFYDGMIFHRVVRKFIVQGGGHLQDMTMKLPRESIANESNNGLKNETGTIAMARFSLAGSANSQFYINVADNQELDYSPPQTPGYAVFGKVVSGMEVVTAISKVKTGYGKGSRTDDVPKTLIIIESARIVEPAN